MTEFPYKLSCKIIDCLVEDGVCDMETVPSADAISHMIKKVITENNEHTKNTQQGGDVGKKSSKWKMVGQILVPVILISIALV